MSEPVEIEIIGQGGFAGARANILDYSIDEDTTSLNFRDLQGGVGGLSFEVVEDPGFDGSLLLPGQHARITDPHAGVYRGVIDGGVAIDDTVLSASGSGLLLPLVSTRKLPSMQGTLSSVIMRYLAACGLQDVPIRFDTEIGTTPVAVPGFDAEVWTQIKKLQAVYQFELAVVDDTIIVRRPRQRMVDAARYAAKRHSFGRTDAAQTVEVYYYNNTWKVKAPVYPKPETSVLDQSIISVRAGETTETNIPVDMWVSEIDPPQQTYVLPWDSPTPGGSVYSVVDKDGQPVTVADWRNGGGELTLSIGADGRSIDVSVRGMKTDARSPFRIASSSDDREYQYSALFIAATGVAFKKEMIWSPTGADLKDAPVDDVVTIDDPLISTRLQAKLVRSLAVISSCGLEDNFEAESSHVNRRGESGVILTESFGEWDAANPTMTFAQFDAEYATFTFADFDAEKEAEVAADFANQAFGGIAGARVRERDSIYRILRARATPQSFSWSSEQDVLFSDWEDEMDENLTFGDFDALWEGKTFEQHYRMPLRKTP